ncbi:MAG: hypothetical protein ACREHV_10580 [Rhizomicrobium sp.]
MSDFASRLHSRRLFRAIELHPLLAAGISDPLGRPDERQFLQRQEQVQESVAEWNADPARRGRILLDAAARKPYKPIEEEGPINQIWIRDGDRLFDLKDRSAAVASTGVFRALRAYVAKEDAEAEKFVRDRATQIVGEGK